MEKYSGSTPFKVFLHRFNSVLPRIRLEQEDANRTVGEMLIRNQLAEASKAPQWVSRFGVKSSLIGSRYVESTELPVHSQDIHEKATFFHDRTLEVFQKWYQKSETGPDHLVHVTCTGFVSPSSAQRIVTEKNWNQKTEVTHAYQMGCYASIPAVRLAEGISAAGFLVNGQQKRIDIAHNELCSLHTNPRELTAEQIVVQTLFSDGHIKYSMSDERTARRESAAGFEVVAHQEWQVPDSHQDMSWIPAPFGMKMTLSREVPEKIGSALNPFLSALAEKAHVSLETLMHESLFAIHPGGPKIVDAVQGIIGLSDEAVASSKQVLFERGNMSSATLPHIWANLLETPQNRLVVSLAFGPGLTIFGSVFRLTRFS